MKFEIGGSYSADDGQNSFYIASDDISLMYNTTIPYDYAYSVFLGEDWRCEIIADSDTGRCVGLQCLMSYLSLSVEYMPLAIPESKRKELYFAIGKPLEKGSGCHYIPFSDEVCFDSERSILCFGNHTAAGEAIELAPHITAVISGGELKCVYLDLAGIPDISVRLRNSERRKEPMKASTKTTVKRAIAFVIDWNLILIISIALLISGGNFSIDYLLVPSTEMFSSAGVIIGLVCLIALPLLKDLLFKNASLGKLIMGLRVVDASSGKPAPVRSLIIRNITFYLPPVELIAFMTNGRTIGDRLSGSTVVEKKKQNTES